MNCGGNLRSEVMLRDFCEQVSVWQPRFFAFWSGDFQGKRHQRLWSLHREYRRIELSINKVEAQSKELGHQILKAKEMEFVARQNIARFSLFSAGGLLRFPCGNLAMTRKA